MENYRKFKEYPQIGKSIVFLMKIMIKFIQEEWYKCILHLYPQELHAAYQDIVDSLDEYIWELRMSFKDCWYYNTNEVVVDCLNEMYSHAFPHIFKPKPFKLKNDSIDVKNDSLEKPSVDNYYLPEETIQFISNKWRKRLACRKNENANDVFEPDMIIDEDKFSFTVSCYCPTSNRSSVMEEETSFDYPKLKKLYDRKFILNNSSAVTFNKFRRKFFDYILSLDNTWKERENIYVPITEANKDCMYKLHYGMIVPEGKIVNVHIYSTYRYDSFVDGHIMDSSTMDSSTMDSSTGKKETEYGYYKIETDNILNKFSPIVIECHPCLVKYLKIDDAEETSETSETTGKTLCYKKLIFDKYNSRGGDKYKELVLYENTINSEYFNPFVTVKYGNGNVKILYIKPKKI